LSGFSFWFTEIIPEHDATSLGKEIFKIMQAAYKKFDAFFSKKRIDV